MMEQVEQYVLSGGRDSDARRAALEWMIMTQPWTPAEALQKLELLRIQCDQRGPLTMEEMRQALDIPLTPAEAWDKLVAAFAAEVPWWFWAALYRLEEGLARLQRAAFIGWVWLTQRPPEPPRFNEQFQMDQADVDALRGIWERAGTKRVTDALMVMNVGGRR